MNAQQLDEKLAAEAAIDEVKELLDAATSDSSRDQLNEELAARQAKLDELMAGFEVGALCVREGGGAVHCAVGQERGGAATAVCVDVSRQGGRAVCLQDFVGLWCDQGAEETGRQRSC